MVSVPALGRTHTRGIQPQSCSCLGPSCPPSASPPSLVPPLFTSVLQLCLASTRSQLHVCVGEHAHPHPPPSKRVYVSFVMCCRWSCCAIAGLSVPFILLLDHSTASVSTASNTHLHTHSNTHTQDFFTQQDFLLILKANIVPLYSVLPCF